MPGGNENNNRVIETEEERRRRQEAEALAEKKAAEQAKVSFAMQSMAASFEVQSSPTVYVFDRKNDAYKNALEARKQKYGIPEKKDWAKLRERAEEKYQKALTHNAETKQTKLDNLVRAISKSKEVEAEKYREAKNRRIDAAPAEALRRFPIPELTVKRLGENEQAPEKVNGKTTVSFTKANFDNLTAIRENRRKFLFWNLKQSPEFKSLQDSIQTFDTAFPDGVSLGDSPEAQAETARSMIASLNQIRENADRYIEKYRKTNYSKACNARKEMARKAAEMAEAKISELTNAIQSVLEEKQANSQSREQFIEEEKNQAEAERLAAIESYDKNREKYYKTESEKVNLAEKKSNERALSEKEKKLKEYNKEEKKYQKSWNKGIEVSNGTSFSTEGSYDFNSLNESYQTKLTMVRMADNMFAEKNNPFRGYRTNPFTEEKNGEQVQRIVKNLKTDLYKDENRENLIPMQDLAKKIRETAPGMKVSYSPNAYLTLSNLKLFDKMMRTPREKEDYQATVSFVKDGKRIPVKNAKDADFAGMLKNGYSCVIDNIEAEPVMRKDEKPVRLKADEKELKGLNQDKLISEGDLVPTETAMKLMNLNKTIVKGILPEKPGDGIKYAPEFFETRLEAVKDLLTERTRLKQFKKNTKELAFNFASESKLKKQLSRGIFNGQLLNPPGKDGVEPDLTKNLDSVYFNPELFRNMLTEGSVSRKTGLNQPAPEKKAEPKAVGLPEKEPEKVPLSKDGNLNPEAYKETAGVVRVNAAADRYYNIEDNFDGDMEYMESMNLLEGELVERNPEARKMPERTFVLEDKSADPLFTKEPSPEDISQTPMGNTTFRMALSSMIRQDPKQIYDMIKDNGDGTVTCKFHNITNRPVLVTVSKKLPAFEEKTDDIFAPAKRVPADTESPLWVSLLEKGYMLSGIAFDYRDTNVIPEEKADKAEEYLDTVKDKIERQMSFYDNDKSQKDIHSEVANKDGLLEGRSKLASESGTVKDMLANLSGRVIRKKTINNLSTAKIFKAMDLVVKSNQITANDLDDISSLKPSDTSDYMLPMAPLLKEARRKLAVKTTEIVTLGDGTKIPYARKPYLEEVLESIQEAADEGGGLLDEQDPGAVQQSCRVLKDKINDYQMFGTNAGTHLVSRRPGNYSAYAEGLFELMDKRTKQNDILQVHSLASEIKNLEEDIPKEYNSSALIDNGNSEERSYQVLRCKREKGLKKVVLQELRDGNPEGEPVEMELNRFVRNMKDMEFQASGDLYDRKEMDKRIAREMIKVSRREFREEFKRNIDRALTDDEMTESVMKLPFFRELSDTVQQEITFKERVENGEDLTDAELNLSYINQRTIQETLTKDASYDNFLIKQQQRVIEMREKDKNFPRAIELNPESKNFNPDLKKKLEEQHEEKVKEADFEMDSMFLKIAAKAKKDIESGKLSAEERQEKEQWLKDNEKAIESIAKRLNENPEARKKMAEKLKSSEAGPAKNKPVAKENRKENSVKEEGGLQK